MNEKEGDTVNISQGKVQKYFKFRTFFEIIKEKKAGDEKNGGVSNSEFKNR